MSKTKASGRRLVRVKRNHHLHWPDGYGTGQQKYRGGEGYVVDLDAPFEQGWLQGQEFKVEEVPEKEAEEAELGDIMNPLALAKLREFEKSLKAERAVLTPQEQILKNEREAKESSGQATVPQAPDPEPAQGETSKGGGKSKDKAES